MVQKSVKLGNNDKNWIQHMHEITVCVSGWSSFYSL